MAKGNNSKNSSKNPKDWANYEFVDIKLNDSHKAALAKYVDEQGAGFVELLDQLLKGGYKVSLSHDEQNKSAIVSLTCKEPGDVNFGYVMTSRAGDWYAGVAIMLFKHYELCDDGDWGADQNKFSNNWG